MLLSLCFYDSILNSHAGSYVCGVCGKKYKYYNCFQTHVRAHRGKTLNFFNVCICSLWKSQIITDCSPSMVLKWVTSSTWVMHVLCWPGIVFNKCYFFVSCKPWADVRTHWSTHGLLLRLTYFSPIESESMVGDGLPPTPNSKNTL